MANRSLIALDYPNANSINVKDENTFRKIVCWLETNKIKQAPKETVNFLSNINSKDWKKTYDKYKKFLGCPETLSSDEESLQWIIGYAIREEYCRKKDNFKKATLTDASPRNVPNIQAENPLDKLDFHSDEFAEGINQLAKLLNITPHTDPTITVKAVCQVITTRLSEHALKNPEQYIVKGTPFPLKDADLGIDLTDPVLKHAAKVLRMLYIQDLRNLQTKANELIVAAQKVTANPKTDTRLGKVGF
ncbi:hypothetical protein WA026_019106 [Henosepilachna vigintioctopunctata]|uniref:RNA transcription, translation and transport factor protein n=1 Tax=Henosepilachna vigintioctopunctata TaxID=420089 RepID=A0AAW1V9C3_9CUCU